MKKFIFYCFTLSLFFFSPVASTVALAAQSAKVIVDGATVHEFPQAQSKSVEQMDKDTVIAVSNIPTEGFYKVRTATGTIGWVSGNDIFIGASAPAPGATEVVSPPPADQPEVPASLAPPKTKANGMSNYAKRKNKKQKAPEKETPYHDNLRLLVLAGVTNLNYGGFVGNSNFNVASNELNLGFGMTIEGQYRWSEDVHLALRVEIYQTSTAAKSVLTPTGPASAVSPAISTTLTVKNKIIPVEVGFMYSPVDSEGFRLGLGAYAGATVTSSTTVAETNYGASTYNSLDPCATVVLQGSIGLTRLIGLGFEGGYRYQMSSATLTSPYFGNGFTPDYSGVFARAGLELRF